jgi:hypothetical protein
MAKGKHAVALFEVIQRDERFKRKTAVGSRTSPSGAVLGGAVYGGALPGGAVRRDAVAGGAASDAPSSPDGCAPSEINHEKAAIESSAFRLQSSHLPPTARRQRAQRQSSRQTFSFDDWLTAFQQRTARLKGALHNATNQTIDRLRSLQLQWMPLAVGTILLICATSVVMLARHVRQARSASQSVTARTTSALDEAHPAVLDVSRESSSGSPAAGFSPELAADVQAAGSPGDSAASREGAAVSPQETPVLPLASIVAQPGKRIVNMHYVLIQSYLDEKTAVAACDFLNQKGIACTIERGVKNWRKSFYQVIGLQGFVHPSGAEYGDYRQRIDTLSKEFAPKPHSYKRFDPMAIKW